MRKKEENKNEKMKNEKEIKLNHKNEEDKFEILRNDKQHLTPEDNLTKIQYLKIKINKNE